MGTTTDTIRLGEREYKRRRIGALDTLATADADDAMSEAVDRIRLLEARMEGLDLAGADQSDHERLLAERAEVRAEMRQWVQTFHRARIDVVRANLIDPPSTDELGESVTRDELDAAIDLLNGVDPTNAPNGAEPGTPA